MVIGINLLARHLEIEHFVVVCDSLDIGSDVAAIRCSDLLGREPRHGTGVEKGFD